MEKIININTNYRKFYKMYLTIVRPLLTPRLVQCELNVLSEIMYLNYQYKDLTQDIKDKLMLNYDDRIKIMDNLDISYATLSNMITSLRKKDFLEGNKLVQYLCITPDDKYVLTYNFTINGMEDK